MKARLKTHIVSMSILFMVTAGVTGLAGCSSAPSSTENQGSPGPDTNIASMSWTAGMDCTACHATESDSANDDACLVASHAAQGLECTTCHDDTDTLTTAHEDMATAEAPSKLKRTAVDDGVCLTCHDATELVTVTADVTVCTDANGTTINPHDMPENDDHAGITCSNCHTMHANAGAAETAPEYCITCHHQEVYECHTCHD